MKNWAQHEIGDIATIDSNKILISGVKTFCPEELVPDGFNDHLRLRRERIRLLQKIRHTHPRVRTQ